MLSGSHRFGQSGVVASDGQVNENKLRKVKFKLGGVIRTIHANSTPNGPCMGKSSSMKSSRSDTPSPLQKLDVQPVCKSNRTHKRRLLDGKYSFGDDDSDEEIRYLEKLNTSKVARCYSTECEDQSEDGSKKHRKISRVLFQTDGRDYGLSRSVKKSKNSRSGRVSADNDYMEDEEHSFDGEQESMRKKHRKEFVYMPGDSIKEMAITTRQQARRTGKDISFGFSASVVEFPNGLSPSPTRKQKEKLSDVEQQLKKAEAAQRRKVQMDKAARESEAEAIRKILGQDSSRKKREGKIKERQEELAQERTANAISLPLNTVRWVMCPTGTVVTFPDDMRIPCILQHKHCSYPPPREKCAGPFCTNPYNNRDSKLKLPLRM